MKSRIRSPTVGIVPAGSTNAVKNQIKRERSYARIPCGCHGNMAVFCGWEREPLFCSAACGRSDAQGIRLCVFMAFINSAINMLKVLVIAIGCGLAVWGVINLLEGYGNDNPGANAHVR